MTEIASDLSEIVERLNDEAMRLHGRGIDRGCVDSSLAGNLALEAADAIERLTADIARMGEALKGGLIAAENIGVFPEVARQIRSALQESGQ